MLINVKRCLDQDRVNSGQLERAARRWPSTDASLAPPCSTPDCSQVTQVSHTYLNQTGYAGTERINDRYYWTEEEGAVCYSSKGKVTVASLHLSRAAAATELSAARLRQRSDGGKTSLSCEAAATVSTGPKVGEQR